MATNTFEHKFKCLGCSLHFTVYSYKEKWPVNDEGTPTPVHCPECGQTSNPGSKTLEFLQWTDASERFIFEFVPGDTQRKEFEELTERAKNG